MIVLYYVLGEGLIMVDSDFSACLSYIQADLALLVRSKFSWTRSGMTDGAAACSLIR